MRTPIPFLKNVLFPAISALLMAIFLISSIGLNGQVTATTYLNQTVTFEGFPDPVCGSEAAVYSCKNCFFDDNSLGNLNGNVQAAFQNAPHAKRIRVEYDKTYNFTMTYKSSNLILASPYYSVDGDDSYFPMYTGVDGQGAVNRGERVHYTYVPGAPYGNIRFTGSVKFPKGTKDGYLAIRLLEKEVTPDFQNAYLWTTPIVIPFIVEGPSEINIDVPILDTVQEPQLPQLVLHAPPGDGSSSEFVTNKTTCRKMQTNYAESESLSANLAVKLGFKTTVGIFVTTDIEFSTTFSAGFSTGNMTYTQTSNETCMTVSEGFSTSAVLDDEGGGDVFIGYGSDLYMGLYPLIKVDEATCQAVRDSGLIYARKPGSLKEFALSKSGIQAKIADLELIVADSTNLPSRVTNNAQNQIDVWNQVLDMNLDNINNPGEQLGPPLEIDNSATKTRQEQITVVNSNTIQYENYIGGSFGIQTKLEIGGSGVSGGFEYKGSTKFGETQNQSNTDSDMIKYTLKDDDAGDIFNVQVFRDPMFGTPMFKMNAGTRSSCPYQGGYQRDQPYLKFTDGSQTKSVSNVPSGSPAVFYINVCNDSDEARTYHIKGDANTNLDGALVKGFGNNLFNTNDLGVEFLNVPANSCLDSARVTIEQSDMSVSNYDNIELYLYPADCQPPTAPIASTISLSASYTGGSPVYELNEKSVSITVAPNPNQGVFNIQLDKSIDDGMLFITDLTGRKVFEKQFMDNETNIPVQQGNLSSGVYFLTLKSGSSLMSQKIIIEK